MENQYKVDGNSTERVGGDEEFSGYAVWRVMLIQTEEVICSFYGPYSFVCATAACKALNENTINFEKARKYKDER